MSTFNGLVTLARKYNYDLNHNLRYLALAKLIEDYCVTEILVLGCGKGVLEYILPEKVKCTSVDIDPEEINIAKKINSTKKNRRFIISDILQWTKHSNQRYQAVLISEVLEHLPDDKTIIKSIREVLGSSKGLLFMTVPNANRLINRIYPLAGRERRFMSEQHLREYRLNELYDLLNSYGFTIQQTKYVYLRFPKEHWIRKLIPVNSRLRELILRAKPGWATYIVTVSTPSYKKD